MNRSPSPTLNAIASASVAIAIVPSSLAAVVSYTDPASWSAAAGPITSIFFTEVEGPWVTDQYAALGVTFKDHVLWESFEAFPSDGVGLVASPSFTGFITMEFDAPRHSVAIDIFAPHQLYLYQGDVLIGSSIKPTFVTFLGITSSVPFDRVIVVSTGVAVIDNLHFGAPIPAPGGLAVLVAAGLSLRRRRRRGGSPA